MSYIPILIHHVIRIRIHIHILIHILNPIHTQASGSSQVGECECGSKQPFVRDCHAIV